MRAALFALLLTACASAPEAAGGFGITGCWASRDETLVETLNWRESAGGLEGELIVFAQGDAHAARNQLTLARNAEGWRLCEPTAEGAPCWQVAHENTGSLEGGRAFIDRFGDRLRIGVVGADGVERKVFEGEREACPA